MERKVTRAEANRAYGARADGAWRRNAGSIPAARTIFKDSDFRGARPALGKTVRGRAPTGVIRRTSRVDARDSESHDKTATGRMAEGAKVPKTSEVPEHGVGFAVLLQCLKWVREGARPSDGRASTPLT